ncbi:DUF6694 family lipoprotein [Xenorhabdus yunnanensis]|uniref:DUF6694 family lipoprotein n=1 Tax=Xenorhabdus yunnanensis TaxID=3025878 RepID=UPI00359C791C
MGWVFRRDYHYIRKVLTVLVLSLFLVRCGELKLDASSNTAMKESIQKINQELSSEDRVKFKKQ